MEFPIVTVGDMVRAQVGVCVCVCFVWYPKPRIITSLAHFCMCAGCVASLYIYINVLFHDGTRHRQSCLPAMTMQITPVTLRVIA